MSVSAVDQPAGRGAVNAARGRGFVIVAATLALLLAGASAPSPLYAVYQQHFHFSATTLTAIFGVYAIALLIALIPAGALSDRLGRKPVILAALAVQALSVVLFLDAHTVGTLFAARVVQGLATGAATGSLSAGLVDLQPTGSTLGSLTASIAPSVGLAAGALGAGALVQLGPQPLRLVYWVELGLLILAAVSVATWALAGFYLSLGPSLAAVLLHTRSHITDALVPTALCSATAVASLLTRRWPSRTSVLTGTALLAAGVAITLIGVRSASAAPLFAGSVIAGLGFGPAFSGSFRSLAPLAPADGRAALLAAIYLVSYLAFSLPALLAGLAVTHWGLRDTATGYAIAVIALAAASGAAAAAQIRPATN